MHETENSPMDYDAFFANQLDAVREVVGRHHARRERDDP